MLKKIKPSGFDWDNANRYKNEKKHGVTYRESEQIFFNLPFKIYTDNKHSQQEKRFFALGQTNQNRQLSISFTIRNQKIRIISARDQSRKERRLYEKK